MLGWNDYSLFPEKVFLTPWPRMSGGLFFWTEGTVCKVSFLIWQQRSWAVLYFFFFFFFCGEWRAEVTVRGALRTLSLCLPWLLWLMLLLLAVCIFSSISSHGIEWYLTNQEINRNESHKWWALGVPVNQNKIRKINPLIPTLTITFPDLPQFSLYPHPTLFFPLSWAWTDI